MSKIYYTFDAVKKTNTMKQILFFATIVFMIIACGSSGNNNDQSSTANVEDGKKIFKQYCIACHGADGQLSLNGAKKFKESTLSLEERITVISEGRKLMTPFKGLLNEAEIKAVAAYTIKLTKGE